MRIGLVQINSVIADFEGNRQQIVDSIVTSNESVDLWLAPEMVLCGYPPLDLLNDPYFVEKQLEQLSILASELKHQRLLLGAVRFNEKKRGKRLHNSAVLLDHGTVKWVQDKTLLPTYDVFDEARYFEPAQSHQVISLVGQKLGVLLCEDIWYEHSFLGDSALYPMDPVEELCSQNLDHLLVLSASPYTENKLETRLELCSSIATKYSVTVSYVNAVGANDSLIFDGHSFAMDQRGRVTAMAPGWDHGHIVWDTRETRPLSLAKSNYHRDRFNAIVCGIRDYVHKSGFQRVHLGLSGGIDSAVCAALCVEALGAENVQGFMMPSTYSSQGSLDDSWETARLLGIKAEILAIEPLMEAFSTTLAPVFGDLPPGLAEENIQARIRGVLMMGFSNKFNSLLIATGNKSELSVGYSTLYGDMAGALCPIGDVLKEDVYNLARFMNSIRPMVPLSSIEKAPSAELRPDQKDEDSLPPYSVLDPWLHEAVVEHRPLISYGEENEEQRAIHRDVLIKLARAEYKRRQSPLILKLSDKAFGMGRRVPIVRKLYEID